MHLAHDRKRVTARPTVGGRGGANRLRHHPGIGLIDWLAPDPVIFNSFPRMSLMIELMELTGAEWPN